MSRYRLELTLSEELLGALDERRGHEPRASFVKRVLREALGRPKDLAEPAAVVKRSAVTEPSLSRGSASPSLDRFGPK